MVGAALSVQQQVPVNEGVQTVIHAADHVMGVHFRVPHLMGAAETAELHAALGEDQLQLREALMGHLQGFKMVAAVPVNCRATNHFRHFRIVQRLADPVEHPLLVVIPDQQADVLQMMAL